MSDHTVSPFDPPPVKRREIFGWCCFDFANSAFTTIIITVVYAVYFTGVVADHDPRAPGWWGTALAVSQLATIFVSPLIGAIADVTARKKTFLLLSAVVCALATMALYFVGPGEIWLALGLVVVANIAFSLGENLCAAFLPEISTAENVGRISGYGWSFGYFGGLLSLVLALAIIKSGDGRVPWTFVMTGAFFLLSSLPTLLLLRERARRRELPAGRSYVALGWGQLGQMWQELPQHRTLAIFFGGMTLYLAGLTAVVAFASVYATRVLHMSQEEIIGLFVLLQLAGVAGAYGFGALQDRVGAKPALVLSLLQWIAVCLWAGVCTTKTEFYIIGVIAGAAMGSLQSAGRAVVSMLTPAGRGGEFFGYWGFFGKLAAVIGQPVFGWIATHEGYRTAILVNAGFFLAGLVILLGLRLRPVVNT
ncbi:MAG: MFS transporter [Opitutaceae bacterium]|nr:MFS transporter [Opitutaceae bacterium]MBP9912459.1 MFS transporter [Opitutaceae bacterium]